jgi:2-keto-3-deoxy-L-rhamnonate aldolase RhmA
MDLMFITNDIKIAKMAENSGVDIVFIDLEINGKYERQGHLDTYITDHKLEDIGKIKGVLNKAKILVRVNPQYEKSKEEIDACIVQGADIIMLPMFKTKFEVEEFIRIVNGRTEICLLLETPQALVRINEIVDLKGIDRIHVGLNDLHLGLGLDFMFELLSEGIVDYLGNIISKKGIKFGFGGIAKCGQGIIPAELIIKEHYRLNSNMVILSRAFREFDENISNALNVEVSKVRAAEKEAMMLTVSKLEENRIYVQKLIRNYVLNKKR